MKPRIDLKRPNLADAIEDILPQTQCTKCGYPCCRDYAVSISKTHSNYNQCPPGGLEGVKKIAKLIKMPVIPLNKINGVEKPRSIAIISEKDCIGCTLCIDACPVDAIIGASKQMHTVIQELCTGCDLCIEPCPVDCIKMKKVKSDKTGWDTWTFKQANNSRIRFHIKKERLERYELLNEKKLNEKTNKKFNYKNLETLLKNKKNKNLKFKI